MVYEWGWMNLRRLMNIQFLIVGQVRTGLPSSPASTPEKRKTNILTWSAMKLRHEGVSPALMTHNDLKGILGWDFNQLFDDKKEYIGLRF